MLQQKIGTPDDEITQHIKIIVGIDIEMRSNGLFGDRPILLIDHIIKFRLDYYLNEMEFMNLTYAAMFKTWDEQEMANQIEQTLQKTEGSLWAKSAHFNPNKPHTIQIICSDDVRDFLNSLMKYKPKLLQNTLTL